MNFDTCKTAHDAYDFGIFNNDILYLLLNQFMKNGNKELQQKFLTHIGFYPQSRRVVDKFREVFDFCKNNNLVEKIKYFIRNNRNEAIWYDKSQTEIQLQELSSIQLFQDEFSPSSSIDKQLFSKVQKINNINQIDTIIEDMNRLMKQKIYWTYYNTQTTRIIEDIFSQHQNVLPTLVDIKGVDFFINDIPLDLKITRIPDGFDETFDKLELIKWLYENQSEQRFGAENRLFLILNDKNHPEQTDKLKITHYEDIKKSVNSYLDNFKSSNLENINFTFGNTLYTAKSDIIFINIG